MPLSFRAACIECTLVQPGSQRRDTDLPSSLALAKLLRLLL
jgi:hypothetical protein